MSSGLPVDTIAPTSPSPPTPPLTPPLTPNEHTALAKGKQKAEGYNSHFQDTEPEPYQETTVYPPVNDDVAETRRVEENLRRWDAAERQRRKSARESLQPATSLVGDISRTASLIWSSRRPRDKHDASLGNHVALQSQENVNSVTLDDLNATPTPSPSPSPSPHRTDSHPQNPFANPSEPISPFADPPHHTLVMTSSSSHNSPTSSGLLANQFPGNPTPNTSKGLPGPPMPLGLPPPRTPPPIKATPSPISPLSSSSRTNKAQDDEPRETRWWHDWLCGCSEGPDRGGDYQAGRTNPFE